MNARSTLERLVREGRPASDAIEDRQRRIHADLLRGSRHVRQADFDALHPRDVEALFDNYDRLFFDGLLARQKERPRLTFRLSQRMTSAGGKTTVRRASAAAEEDYDIGVSTVLLFGTFRSEDSTLSMGGLPCRDRLEALQRVVEHELVHLVEFWLWRESSCSRARFRDIAHRFFAHTEHGHRLITPRERARTEHGIVPGSRVAFVLEGRRHVGVVNRITKRATVLVERESGQLFSDGRRYLKYYVPVEQLELE